MRRDGLRVRSVTGDFTVRPMSGTDDLAEVGLVDAVLVATGTWWAGRTALSPAQTAPLPEGNQPGLISRGIPASGCRAFE